MFERACQNCKNHKVDEKGNDYCDICGVFLDFVNVYCEGLEFEEKEEDL